MRLAIINHHGRTPGGSENTLLAFVERFPEEIEPIFFFFEDGEYARKVTTRYPQSSIVPMSERMAGATRKSLKISAVTDSFSHLIQLTKAIRKARVDAVLTNSVKAHYIGSIAAKILGLPLINYIHDVLEGPSLKAMRMISGLTAQSRIVCSSVVSESLGLKRTSVIHSPIEIDEYESLPSKAEARHLLGLPADDLLVVGLVGRIAPWKGQDRFIRIAQRVLQVTDAHFAIVGGPVFGCPPEYMASLHSMVEQNGLQHRIHFIPWQSNMSAVYSAIDIGCNCSTKEPFGRTTVEAQFHKVPVICFDDAGVCETFDHGDSGMKIVSFREDEYAEAILSYLTNHHARQSAGERAKFVAQRLDIDRLAPIFIDAVKSGIRS